MIVPGKLTLDDGTVSYMVAAQVTFDTLRRIAVQLAGFELLNEIDAGERNLQDTPLSLAEVALREAKDNLHALLPTQAALVHYQHLLQACNALGTALDMNRANLVLARGSPLARDGTTALKRAIDHLRHASHLLPGFEIVDFSSACCACCGTPAPRPQPIAPPRAPSR
jgi:hypothetical protein